MNKLYGTRNWTVQKILSFHSDKTFGGLITAFVESAKKFAEGLEELRKQLNDIVDKLQEAVKATLPKLKESYDKIFNVFITLFDTSTKLATAYIEAILKIVNEHQKDIEELVTVASELVQDVAKIIFKGAGQIEKELKEFVQLLVQQVRALPVYEMAQGLYKEALNYKVPDYIINPVEEFCKNIKNFLPTQELKDLFSTIYNYVLMHVKHQQVNESFYCSLKFSLNQITNGFSMQQVDDTNEVKKIYSQTLTAIRSLIALIQSHATFENVFSFVESQFPIDISYLKRLPGVSIVRFSVLRLLFNQELPTVSDFYYTYR